MVNRMQDMHAHHSKTLNDAWRQDGEHQLKSNAIGTLETPFNNDPPTQADMELMRSVYNNLVGMLRRI